MAVLNSEYNFFKNLKLVFMKIKFALSTFIFYLLLSVAVISCSKSSGTGGGTGTMGGGGGGGYGGGGLTGDIGMSGSAFSPSSFTVKVGTAVKWMNNDNVAHTVTSDDGTTFNSGSIAAGNSFSFTPTVAGTFPYHCNLHAGMTATLTVTN